MERLLKEHRKMEMEIQKALKTFKSMQNRPSKDLFTELCFCLLTPQSKAFSCWEAVKKMRGSGLLYSGREEEIKKILRKKTRFHNNKARHIVEARKTFMESSFDWKKFFQKQSAEIREWLVENVNGMGYKEASHFLRNIGFRELAILDRHILKNLLASGAVTELPKTLGRKQYMEIEEKFKRFSQETCIPMDELDLLFWAMQTGKVFK